MLRSAEAGRQTIPGELPWYVRLLASRSPLGFNAGDTNLYRYVGNSPMNSLDPLGLYDDDVHFYMTYYIGLALGLGECQTCLNKGETKNVSAAFVIAWAAAYTDYNPKTRPDIILGGEDVRRRFHFRTSGDKVEAGSAEAAEIAKMGVEKCDPLLTGIGLHALQDSFSHEGFGPAVGHLRAGHNPDDPSRDVKKAMRMAKATYDVLAEYLKKCCKKDPKVKWEDIANKIERQFALGSEEQKLDYAKQVAARVERWKALISDDWKVKAAFVYMKKDDPWATDFEKIAGTVIAPKKR
jgi:hypothetical protein